MDRLDISESRTLFGEPAALYGPIVAGIVPRLAETPYRFWDNATLADGLKDGTVGYEEYNSIAAAELLISAHLAANSSLVRGSRWFEATWREYKAENLLGWAACCRSLLEAVGDTIDGLNGMAATIAENMSLLMQALSGYSDRLLNLASLESQLIHFTHARKVVKADKNQVPASHVARQTFEYIRLLENAGLKGAAALYSELCEIGHPAKNSVSWMFVPIEGGFRLDAGRDANEIQQIVTRYRDDLHLLPSLAFNPGLLVLRVLVRFRLFPPVPELKGFAFQGARGWEKIEPILNVAPPTLRRNILIDRLIAGTVTSPDIPTNPR